jgi:flagellin
MLPKRITEDAMTSILNNIAALGASNQLSITNEGLQKTIQQLTTGRRINNASDDAAGLGISNQLNSEVAVANQGQMNGQNGNALLQTGDGALNTISNLLQRQAQLVEEATSGTVGTNGVANINAEYSQNSAQIADILKNTTFDSASVFGSTASIAVGDYAAVALTNALKSTTITSGTDASAAGELAKVQADIQTVSTQRATLGAAESTLSNYSSMLATQSQNLQAASSTITDANVSQDVVNLSKFQILNQSGISALGQANTAAQSILALLR